MRPTPYPTQNAVVVIVVRRYAGLVVVVGLGLLSSSIVTMMTSGRDSSTCPSQEYSTPAFGYRYSLSSGAIDETTLPNPGKTSGPNDS